MHTLKEAFRCSALPGNHPERLTCSECQYETTEYLDPKTVAEMGLKTDEWHSCDVDRIDMSIVHALDDIEAELSKTISAYEPTTGDAPHERERKKDIQAVVANILNYVQERLN